MRFTRKSRNQRNPNHPSPSVVERQISLVIAEAIKRKYFAELDQLVANYQREIATALAQEYPPAYALGEIAGYVSRLAQRLKKHDRAATERMLVAYDNAENGQDRLALAALTYGGCGEPEND